MIALGIILLILLLLAIMPLGVLLRYDEKGLTVKLIGGPFRYKLWPRKKVQKKDANVQEKATKPEAAPAEKTAEDEKKGGAIKEFMPLIKTGFDFLGDFRRRLRVNRLELKLTLAGGDPADLAIRYGRAQGALGGIWPFLERSFQIKKRDVAIQCDFQAEHTTVFALVELTATFGRLTALSIKYGIRVLKEFMKLKNKNKAVQTI